MKRTFIVLAVFLALGVEAQAPVPVIKVEDALAISKLETQILSNANQRQQLEVMYQKNADDKKRLELDFAKAQTDALKHASADEAKYMVDPDKLQIVAKPVEKAK
jgi:hypothetical protein